MKRWYVIQIYAGYEEQVRADILRRVQEAGLQEQIGEILVPSAKVQKTFFAEGESPDEEQQLFPGYMLVECDITPEFIRLITTTSRVIRFLGGKVPASLTQQEVQRVLGQVRGEVVVASKKVTFETGKEIEIVDGPFSGFVGIIDKIDEEGERLTVMVSIFGRMTPVELGFNQVKR